MGEAACGTGDRRSEALRMGGVTRCIVPLSALAWTLTLALLLIVAGLAGPGSVRAAEDTPTGEREVQVGDGDTFTAVDGGNGSGSLEISATVRAVGEHAPQREPQKRWVQEGLAVYAEAAAGDTGRTSRYLESFQEDPGENLTGWGGYRADYGAAYAFISYLVQRAAPDILGQMLDEPRAGAAGLDSVLEARDSPSTFATLFDDWVMANFLDGRPPVTYPFHHDTLDIQPSVVNLQGPLPYVGTIRVPNYGAVYLDLPLTSGDVTVSVTVDGVD